MTKDNKTNAPIVVLNSGGFDSVILLHCLRSKYPEKNIYSLFFNYGQSSLEQERKCSKKSADKLGCTFKEVEIPKFSWTKSEFYKEGFNSTDTEYLEWRNLIFLSYALSLSESVGADKIYMAILKSHCGYNDTSLDFIEKFNSISNISGVEFCTPFTEADKLNLADFAYDFEITEEDFHSCDNSVDGNPCGKCPDCKAISTIMEDVRNRHKLAISKFHRYGVNSKEFEDRFLQTPIDEVRILSNNSCQLNCPHCYHGGNETHKDILTEEQFKSVIDKCVRSLPSLANFHFSGKEPLYDESVLSLMSYIQNKYPKIGFDVVTNGINIPKFAKHLKALSCKRVCLSVDSLGEISKSLHGTASATLRAMQALKEVNIPIEVFIDVGEFNYSSVADIIEKLIELGINNFYIRLITPIGNAENLDSSDMQPLMIEDLFNTLCALFSEHTDISGAFAIPAKYTYKIVSDSRYANTNIWDCISYCAVYLNNWELDNFRVIPEWYCGSFESQITITSDGYLIGCASEISRKNYYEFSKGTILDNDLSTLIQKAKLQSVQNNRDFIEQGLLANCMCSLKN